MADGRIAAKLRREKEQEEHDRRQAAKNAGSPATAQPRTNVATGKRDVQDDKRGHVATDRNLNENGSGEQRSNQGGTDGISRFSDFFAGADEREREAGATISPRNIGTGQGNNHTETIASRLGARARELADTTVDRIANIGKRSYDDEDDEDDEARENRLHAAFEAWRAENGGKFSPEEAAERREGLLRKLTGWSDDADKFLSISNAEQEEARIWHMDEDEATPLVNILLKRAMKDETTAVVIRAAMDGDDYIRAAVVLLPRLGRTAVWHRKHGGFNLAPWEGPR